MPDTYFVFLNVPAQQHNDDEMVTVSMRTPQSIDPRLLQTFIYIVATIKQLRRFLERKNTPAGILSI